jgi:hypothetical protein
MRIPFGTMDHFGEELRRSGEMSLSKDSHPTLKNEWGGQHGSRRRMEQTIYNQSFEFRINQGLIHHMFQSRSDDQFFEWRTFSRNLNVLSECDWILWFWKFSTTYSGTEDDFTSTKWIPSRCQQRLCMKSSLESDSRLPPHIRIAFLSELRLSLLENISGFRLNQSDTAKWLKESPVAERDSQIILWTGRCDGFKVQAFHVRGNGHGHTLWFWPWRETFSVVFQSGEMGIKCPYNLPISNCMSRHLGTYFPHIFVSKECATESHRWTILGKFSLNATFQEIEFFEITDETNQIIRDFYKQGQNS